MSDTTVYEIDTRGYTRWTPAEQEQAHAFVNAHGIDPKRVALNGTVRIDRDPEGVLWLVVWAYDHNTNGQIVVEAGKPVGRTHRIRLRTAPPNFPEWANELAETSGPDSSPLPPFDGTVERMFDPLNPTRP